MRRARHAAFAAHLAAALLLALAGAARADQASDPALRALLQKIIARIKSGGNARRGSRLASQYTSSRILIRSA